MQARSLATAARSADTKGEPATGLSVAPSPKSGSVGGTTFAAALTPDAATLCVRVLTDGDGTTALAVDSGSYAGHPAIVVVVPTQGDPASLDVFVVKPGCGTGSADILEFQRIPAS